MARRAVITGMGVVSPNGLGREAFWQATRQGRSGVRRVPLFESQQLPVTIAGHAAEFRPGEICDEHELHNVGRVVPMALAATAEAFADAGLEPAQLSLEERRRTGVMLGTGGAALEFVERQFSHYFSGEARRCSVYTIPSSTPGTLASEISMRFGLRGFSHLISTGCTSSTDALGYARQHILLNDADVVVAGGVDAPLGSLIVRAFALMKILTSAWNHQPSRGSRPFSADRSGLVLGEGAWIFIVEDAERARARGARIYGELAGYGSTCEAFHRVRLDESGEEPARAMSLALASAGLPPEAIGYANLHGTSTVLNDRIETRAVKRALGRHAFRTPMSALKSLIGHPQGASGAAGVAATLLAMRDECLPPTINLDIPDPECDLDYVPHRSRRESFEHALCNCIGFGSKNSALILSHSPVGT
ncbi:MAG TPA: beta-ketoacyl-[acyl-carrier-protein] synthase family protein [Terriglobales bacterium]|nr:beta-ketoacyl-[acyl-carrier-protein] synthase family protein [Terriglobales bacterium]